MKFIEPVEDWGLCLLPLPNIGYIYIYIYKIAFQNVLRSHSQTNPTWVPAPHLVPIEDGNWESLRSSTFIYIGWAFIYIIYIYYLRFIDFGRAFTFRRKAYCLWHRKTTQVVDGMNRAWRKQPSWIEFHKALLDEILRACLGWHEKHCYLPDTPLPTFFRPLSWWVASLELPDSLYLQP